MTRITETSSANVTRSDVARHAQSTKSGALETPVAVGALANADQVERGTPLPGTGTVATGMPDSAATPGGSAFMDLLAGRSPQDLLPRILGQQVGLERDLSPDAKTLSRLNDVELAASKLPESKAELAARLQSATQRIRQGVMLALSDAIGTHATAESKVPHGLVSNVSESLIAEKVEGKQLAAVQQAMLVSKAHFPLGMDINAYVQAVLRESYLLQNEILKDYADKVKYFNDQKKAIRKKLAVARQLALDVKGGANVPDFLWWIDLKSGDEGLNYRTDGPGKEQESSSDNSARGTGGSSGSQEPGGSDSPDQNAGTPPPTTTTSVSVSTSFFNGSTIAPPASESEVSAFEKLAAALRTLSSGNASGRMDDLIQGVLNSGPLSLAGLEAQVLGVRKLFDTLPGFAGDRFQAFADCLAKNVAQLPTADAALLMQTLLQARTDYANQGDTHKKEGIDILLQCTVPNATAAQLGALKDAAPANWQELEAAMAADAGAGNPFTKVNERLMAWHEQYAALPQALKDSPLDEVGRLYAEVLMGGPNGEQAEEILKCKLRNLYPEDVEKFTAAISGTPEGLDACKSIFGDSLTVTTSTLPPPADPSSSSNSLDNADSQPPSTTTPNAPGSGDDTPKLTQPADKSDYMDNYVKNLEDQLETSGEDAQLANVDLQNALQVQQQTLQMMSNISKMLFDTAMSIIRKIGG